MKTFMAKADKIERNWYLIDADGMILGRLASEITAILRGKTKPIYTPNVDCGDYVVVINCDKIKLTGNKLDDKLYKTHSGYGGGYKEVTYKTLMQGKSDFVVQKAVKGMLPKSALGKKLLAHLKVFKGAEHTHQAQSPKLLDIKGGKR